MQQYISNIGLEEEEITFRQYIREEFVSSGI